MKRISALLLATAAFVGCNHHDHAPVSPEAREDGAGATPQTNVGGNLIREFKLAGETSVRFTEAGGAVSLSLTGHVDDLERNRILEDKLFGAASLEEAYRLLDPAGEVPGAILEHDRRPASGTGAVEAAPPALPGAAVGSAAPAATPLAKESHHAVPSSDSWWDWTGDANWWKGDVVGYKCGWHEAAHYTNVTWADDWRHGWFGRGYLMAASHTYGANAYAYLWSNGAWTLTNSAYLQPRHYIVWSSNDTSKRYRRYRVAGNGGAYARIHWGMRWDSQAPSDLGVICQY